MLRIAGANSMLKVMPSLSRIVLPFNSVVMNSLRRFRIQMTTATGVGYLHIHRYSSTGDKNKNELSKVKNTTHKSRTFEQVKENTKTASYLSIIIFGLGLTGYLIYNVFRELFSSKSPHFVYSTALKRCTDEIRVQVALGEPIRGFGEETRRGRRRHISHLFYEKEGVHYLRMKFYIQGSQKHGTVLLEMKEDDKGQFQYRYLLVIIEDFPPETIIIEDNRYDKTPSVGDKSFDLP